MSCYKFAMKTQIQFQSVEHEELQDLSESAGGRVYHDFCGRRW